MTPIEPGAGSGLETAHTEAGGSQAVRKHGACDRFFHPATRAPVLSGMHEAVEKCACGNDDGCSANVITRGSPDPDSASPGGENISGFTLYDFKSRLRVNGAADDVCIPAAVYLDAR